jgi:hypothetical protein
MAVIPVVLIANVSPPLAKKRSSTFGYSQAASFTEARYSGWLVLSIGTVSFKEGDLPACPLRGSSRMSHRPVILVPRANHEASAGERRTLLPESYVGCLRPDLSAP